MTIANYRVQGFLEGQRVRQKQSIQSKNLQGSFIGDKLEEMEIIATVRSAKEMADLVRFLNESTPAFTDTYKSINSKRRN